MNHEIEVSNLMFNKTSEDQIDFKKYDINVELDEESRNDKKTILKYSLDLTSNPKNAVINISGNTILSGEQSEIEEFLKQEDEKTPEVVSLIYQELFPLMYIISKNMKIPSPAHTISQNNIRGPEEQDSIVETSNEKTFETQTNEIDDNEKEIDQLKTESEKTEIKNDVKDRVDKPTNENESS
ncbi:MAG: hypothetical protein OEM79_01875 [Nitrosopumilus sp.]|nr:hypothetical protein [Nitrosopumilus sp.]